MGDVVRFPGAPHRHSGERVNQHARTPEAAALRAKQREIRNLNKCRRFARENGIKIAISFPAFIQQGESQCTDSPRPWSGA